MEASSLNRYHPNVNRSSHYDTEDAMSEATPWIDRIGRRLARWRSRGLGDTWVIAVSGGGDSVGLLRVLHRLAPAAGLRLSVAHLDHGVRGEAARADAAFVAGLADSLGLPLRPGSTGSRRVPATSESDARDARYDWLYEVAQTQGGRASWRSATRAATTRPRRSCTAPHPRHRPARAGRHPPTEDASND